MVWGDAVTNLETFVWILNHVLVSVQPKRIKLGQTISLNVIFYVITGSPSSMVCKRQRSGEIIRLCMGAGKNESDLKGK